jgi:hypothetical protein
VLIAKFVGLDFDSPLIPSLRVERRDFGMKLRVWFKDVLFGKGMGFKSPLWPVPRLRGEGKCENKKAQPVLLNEGCVVWG